MTGIQFTILAEAFFSLCGHGGDRRSEDTGWPKLHTEATWPQRKEGEREHEREKRRRDGAELCLRSPSKVSYSGPFFLIGVFCPVGVVAVFILGKLQLQPHPSLSASTPPPTHPTPPWPLFPQTDTSTLLDVSFLLACRNKGAQSCET